MADAVNRTTKEYRQSIHTPDFPVEDWIINPNLSAVAGVENKYWKISGDVITEMNASEKQAVDDAEAAAQTTANRAEAVANPDEVTGIGVRVRALIELFNKRDNYLVNRIAELQAAFDSVKASSGPADNIRAAIPASWLATNTRTRPEAIQAYKDDINAGNVDT